MNRLGWQLTWTSIKAPEKGQLGDSGVHAGHVLTFGRGCLSFEREVLAEAYPECEPSTGKLIRQALEEDTSAHKVKD